MRLIDADALKRKSQEVATEAWKLGIKATVEVILNQFIDYIDAAPTIKPEPQWIPCSERLPEIEHGGQRRGWYLTTDDYECVNITQYEFHCSFLKTGWQSDIQITAWMPLPKPYRKGIEK